MEEKTILEYKRISIPVYGDIVELYYGEPDDFSDMLLKKYKCTLDNFNGYCQGYSCILEKTTGKITNIMMVLFVSSDVLPSSLKKVHTIHHEAIHVAWNILDRVGIKIDESNHEALTYLSGYIASRADEQIDKWKK